MYGLEYGGVQYLGGPQPHQLAADVHHLGHLPHGRQHGHQREVTVNAGVPTDGQLHQPLQAAPRQDAPAKRRPAHRQPTNGNGCLLLDPLGGGHQSGR